MQTIRKEILLLLSPEFTCHSRLENFKISAEIIPHLWDMTLILESGNPLISRFALKLTLNFTSMEFLTLVKPSKMV